MTVADDRVHRFTVEEYHQMADLGWFDGKRVELLEGQILEMSPQNEAHASVISRLNRFLITNLPERYEVRCQAPMSVGGRSEPEPDFAVIAARTTVPKGRAHPRTAILVIEVSDTTLARDRRKAAAYAAAGVQEYWIVNLVGRNVEQYTMPEGAGEEARYAEKVVAEEGGVVPCGVLPLPAMKVGEVMKGA